MSDVTARLRCHRHGPQRYVLDRVTERLRCPIAGCPAFMNLEVAVRASILVRLDAAKETS